MINCDNLLLDINTMHDLLKKKQHRNNKWIQ